MKRLINISAICFSLLILASGCKKFLTQDVPGAYAENDFYKSDADITQAVTGIYDMMQAHYNASWGSIYMVKSLLSDESNCGGANATDQPQYQSLDDFKHDAANAGVRDAWRMCYFTIYRANKVINKTDPSNSLRKRLVAEAKTLRAYNYLELVSLWGDVPLVLNDIPPSQYTSTPRAPKADVYGQIVQDLTEAIADLPLKSASERFRVSKGTAQALLGKAYLFQEKWSEAAAQFETVITSNQYSLAPSVGEAFSRGSEFGSESLFEISYDPTRNYDWGNYPWDWQPESNIHVQLMGPRADYYTKAPADSLIGGWGFIRPKKKLWDAFVAAGDVQRRRQTIMSEAELTAAGGGWSNPSDWDYEGYFQRKYGTFTTQTGPPVGELNYGTNWRHLRYADVLLMAAEANNKMGGAGDSKAQTYLNMIRSRANLGAVSATGTALFDAIVKERQLELAFEGVRFVDLVRWGRANTELSSLGFVAGKNELLPIPDYDVRAGGLTQNPGY